MNLSARLDKLVSESDAEAYSRLHIAQAHSEIERLHAQFAPLACIYDDGDEAQGGDPCIWCDRTKPIATFQRVTGTAPTYAKSYAVSCPEADCKAPVQHRCLTQLGRPRTEPHKSRKQRGKDESDD